MRTPRRFRRGGSDEALLGDITRQLAAELGLPVEPRLRLVLDDADPPAPPAVTGFEPVVLLRVPAAELFDAAEPGHVSDTAAAEVIGRLLCRVRDRSHPLFGGTAPADTDLPAALALAWDVHSVGRLERMGYVHRDNWGRWLYRFRVHHGFTDQADGAFSRLWHARLLTWTELTAISGQASPPGASNKLSPVGFQHVAGRE